MATQTEELTGEIQNSQPPKDSNIQRPNRDRIRELLEQGITDTKQIAREIGCSHGNVRKIAGQWKREQELKAKTEPPSFLGSDKVEAQTKVSTPINTKSEPSVVYPPNLQKPAKCSACHQEFKRAYQTCPECNRKIIPDDDVLTEEDVGNVLRGVANLVLPRIGCSPLTDKEIETGSKCIGALAKKYRWTLFGMLPEITTIAWIGSVAVSRAPEIMQHYAGLKAEQEKKKKEAGQGEPTSPPNTLRNIAELGKA